jgi:phosphoribosyl 1,2-cyclic phosphate phosphodiesterase
MPGTAFHVGGIEVLPIEQGHGFSRTLGFRFGDFAYSTDVVDLSEDAFSLLAGIDVWMIGTLTEAPHPTHCHVDKALDWIARVAPRQAALTHLGLDLDHASLAARLPAGVEPAYDGMIIEVAEAVRCETKPDATDY